MPDLAPLFDAAGKQYNVDPRLLATIFQVESGSNPNSQDGPQTPWATNGERAQGGMQMLPSTAAAMGASNPRDITQAIPAAARYIAEGLDKTGTVAGAASYYHGGPDTRIWGPRTQAYAAKVVQLYNGQGQGQQQAQADPDAAAGAAIRSQFQDAAPSQPPEVQKLLDSYRQQGTGGTAPASAPAANDDDAAAGAALRQAFAHPAAPSPANAPLVDRFGPTIQDAQGMASQGLDAVRAADSAKTADQRIREFLAPDPAATYGDMLPLAATGDGPVRLALPNSARDLALGAYELSQGPATGTVTPLATAALAQGVIGGAMPTPAAGTGAAIGNSLLPQGAAGLGRNEAPDYLGAALRADPAAVEGNRLGVVADGPLMPNPAVPQAAVPANRLGGSPAAGGPQPGMGASQPQPGMGAPQPGMGPAPNSVGAAASSATEANVTPAQIQAYRSTAEGQKLLERQPTGERDLNAYVPGVDPTLAQTEQSVAVSRELKALGLTSPEVSAESKAVAAAHNDTRQQFFASQAGSPVDVANAKAARSAQATADLDMAFGNKQPTDAQPVVELVQQVLAEPRNSENTALKSYIQPLLNRFSNADGTLKSDPEVLYGLREDINRMMSKPSIQKDPDLAHVQNQLGVIKGALDNVIEQGAPGYRQYLTNYANASRPIEAMETLQEHEPKLFDAQNRMQYSRVQNMMRQIVDSRSAPGINPYKSIPDETMQNLWNLRDDLRRAATAEELAKAPGSDSAQNFMDIARLGGNALLQGAANYVAPGVGSLALAGAKRAFAPILGARAARQQTTRGMELLRPDRTAEPLRNRLGDQP